MDILSFKHFFIKIFLFFPQMFQRMLMYVKI